MADHSSSDHQKTLRTPMRRRWLAVLVALILLFIAVLGSTLYYQRNSSSEHNAAGKPSSPAAAATVKDGFIANNYPISPFDADLPALAKLNPKLLAAVQSAARDAEADGITMHITAGWRSAAYQQQLLDEAIVTYGSSQEARKYVSTPQDSHHVSGDAVDIGPTDADSWLSQYGSNYGLCQTYANEMWHYELAVEPGGICPEQKIDASGA